MAKVWLFGAALPVPKTLQYAYDALIVQPSFSIPTTTGTSQPGICTQAVIIAAMSAWKTSLTVGTVVLFTNNMTPTKLTNFEDIVEPTASWYAEHASPLGAIYIDAGGQVAFTAPSVEYVYTGTDAATIVYGWGYIDVTA